MENNFDLVSSMKELGFVVTKYVMGTKEPGFIQYIDTRFSSHSIGHELPRVDLKFFIPINNIDACIRYLELIGKYMFDHCDIVNEDDSEYLLDYNHCICNINEELCDDDDDLDCDWSAYNFASHILINRLRNNEFNPGDILMFEAMFYCDDLSEYTNIINKFYQDLVNEIKANSIEN